MGVGSIALTPEQFAIVTAILQGHLPGGSSVAVFGSRATGRARRFSDLDLIIDAGRGLSLDEPAALREAFSDSYLPWRVDVVDRWEIGEGFWAMIAADAVPLLVVPAR